MRTMSLMKKSTAGTVKRKSRKKRCLLFFWIADGMVGGAEKIYCSERV